MSEEFREGFLAGNIGGYRIASGARKWLEADAPSADPMIAAQKAPPPLLSKKTTGPGATPPKVGGQMQDPQPAPVGGAPPPAPVGGVPLPATPPKPTQAPEMGGLYFGERIS